MKSVFGRYIPGNGFLYRVDPRLKLLINIFYIVLIFLVRSVVDVGLLLIPLIIVQLMITKSFLTVLRMVKIPFYIALVIFLVNLYTVDLETVLKDNYFVNGFWKIAVKNSGDIKTLDIAKDSLSTVEAKLTSLDVLKTVQNNKVSFQNLYGFSYDAVNRTIMVFFRIYIMILSMSLLTNTTRPILLTKSIEDVLWPLKLFFIPVHIIAMIISIALRFIPTLLDEAQRIMKAQSSRGVDFRHGNIKDKIQAFTTLIIPLFVSSFAKAEDLGNSMETRGYDPYAVRTRYRKLTFSWRDVIILLIVITITTLISLEIHYFSTIIADYPWYSYIRIV
ncbi:energy-coupling factor transporter transmembrane protein EcfT [Mycoplasma sp. NEAQ87857]|uniref:energy-coupling factor transporter transmembrane component T family protein n=1 Tax=Mycoplasma sp. NEAQ87857 TaxID=2683967 RepID=UPI0013177F06|nr:energy-coupling factor transporter transmembrane component T [Mycoplasma sp. NEAQ87857]QGZ97406.1 energy-coupling factor transporter transmembrane protein EcfT [Mycoplasma sp. NEAQ87857]